MLIIEADRKCVKKIICFTWIRNYLIINLCKSLI